MRIAFAVHAYSPAVGGAERYAEGLAEAMASIGHDVHVLAPNRRSAEAFYEYGHAEAGSATEDLNGVTVHRITLDAPRGGFLRSVPADGLISESARFRLWNRYADALDKEVQRVAPDATITLPHNFPNVGAALRSTGRGVTAYAPLLHEEDPAWQVDPIAALIEQADVAVALTAWEADRLVTTYGAAPRTTVVAPPGLAAPPLNKVAALDLDATYFVAVGRRSRSKNLTEIARAVDILRARGRDVRLVVVGPEADRSVDHDLMKYGDAVVLVGEVDEQAKWEYLRGARALVSMSLHESFGIAMVESWRMGRPVIARAIPMSSDLVNDGVDGYLVDGDESLIARLDELLEDPERASRMGAAGCETAMRYTWESSARELLSALVR